jgi:hypothetical protein
MHFAQIAVRAARVGILLTEIMMLGLILDRSLVEGLLIPRGSSG